MCPAAELGCAKLAGLAPCLGTGPVSPWGCHGSHWSWCLQQELVLILDFQLLVKIAELDQGRREGVSSCLRSM